MKLLLLMKIVDYKLTRALLIERLKQATVVAREYGLANPPVFLKMKLIN